MFKGSRYLFQGPSFWGPPATNFLEQVEQLNEQPTRYLGGFYLLLSFVLKDRNKPEIPETSFPGFHEM